MIHPEQRRFNDEPAQRPPPPSQPPGWADPDPLYVEPEPIRPPYTGWHREPVTVRRDMLLAALATAILVALIALAATDTTPQGAPEGSPANSSGLSSAYEPASVPPALPGAPQPVVHNGSGDTNAGVSQTRHPRVGKAASSPATESGAPQPTGEVGPAPPPVAFAGWASWCAPTPTRCQSWGGKAKLGAVASFRWGDEPYDVLVTYRGRAVLVRVVSFCACGDRRGIPTVIDLSPAAIAELTPTWRRDGIIRVHYELVPDQHPEDPPEHPDDRRMRAEDR